MTPDRFEVELRWAGWRAMAARAFGLRPAESHALVTMVRAPGRVVAFETLAAFDYDGRGDTGGRGVPGSHEGVKSRLQRLRAKLADVGCGGAVEIVTDGKWKAAGARVALAEARRIDEALRYGFGVEVARAA